MQPDLKPTPVPAYDTPTSGPANHALVYTCAINWEQLQQTSHAQVRHCAHCNQDVFQVTSADEFKVAIASRRCVMLAQELLVGVPGHSGSYRVNGPTTRGE